MRTWIYSLIAAAVVISGIVPSSAQSNARRLACRGEVKFGSLDSAIGGCGFITKSGVGNAILGVCTGGSRCVVDAEVEGDLVTRLFSVKLDEPGPSDFDFVKNARFRTPSKQIHCMFVTSEGKAEPNGVACDINQSFVRVPVRPRPSDCEYDWGQRFELGNDSDAGLECASDWVGSDESPVLAYGNSIKAGKIVCSSEETGLTCKNANGRGFFLSRRAQRIF
jgi:hypothetical protein